MPLAVADSFTGGRSPLPKASPEGRAISERAKHATGVNRGCVKRWELSIRRTACVDK